MKAFKKSDFSVVRITGSHTIMKKEGHPTLLSVPCHGKKTLGRGLLKRLINDAGISVDDFVDKL